MEIPFPAASSVWNAQEPRAWGSEIHLRTATPLTFRTSLRDLAGRGIVASTLDAQALWILLHGLVSISWTLLWRDLADLSMVHESKIVQWKDSLRQAFGAWIQHLMTMWSNRRVEVEDTALEQLYWFGIPFAHLGRPIGVIRVDKHRRYIAA
jgi:hypothetical protein